MIYVNCRAIARSIARSFARSLDRLITPSLARPHTRSLDRSVDRSLARSIARSLDRSIDPSLAGSNDARSLDRSLGRSVARSLDRYLARSVERRSFARSLARSQSLCVTVRMHVPWPQHKFYSHNTCTMLQLLLSASCNVGASKCDIGIPLNFPITGPLKVKDNYSRFLRACHENFGRRMNATPTGFFVDTVQPNGTLLLEGTPHGIFKKIPLLEDASKIGLPLLCLSF